MKRNANWETRDSLTFSTNEDMNSFKMKKDRFLNKLRFIDERESSVVKAEKPIKTLSESVNLKETPSRYMIADLYKDPAAGARYQTTVLDPLKKSKDADQELSPLEIMIRNQQLVKEQ